MFEHRKAQGNIQIKDINGKPLANTEVDVKQLKHDFLFGSALFQATAYGKSDPVPEGVKNLVENALALFNFATLPFYWGAFEPERGKTKTVQYKKAAEYLTNRGVSLKGHPLCWHTVCAPWLLDMSNAEIFDTQIKRITRDVTDFKGLINMWDVINEVVIMPIFDKYDNGVTRICKEKGRISLVREVFAAARAADPNACLLINDFEMSESYDILIEGILEAGIKIDAIGLQSHMHQGVWSEEKIAEILERFSRFKLPLHFTEINIVSGKLMPPDIVDLNDFVTEEWPSTEEGEQRQADDVCKLYRQLFAHPLVEAITYWNFSDGGWLNAPAGLATADGRLKPAYHAMDNLINKEWKTTHKTRTNADGFIEFTGFKGIYEAAYAGGAFTFELR